MTIPSPIRQLKVTGADIREKYETYTILLEIPYSYETMVTILGNLPDNGLIKKTNKSMKYIKYCAIRWVEMIQNQERIQVF